MKLLRFGGAGKERPGILGDDGIIRDLSSHCDDIDGSVLSPESLNRLRALDLAELPAVAPDVRLGTPIAGIGKMMCIGLNYFDHAAETGMEPPDHPILFLKANSAIIGPNDNVELPRGSKAGDWEVELGVVIGRTAKYVSEGEALTHVAGYTIVNDVSERNYQTGLSGQWTKGKSCDTFGPTGPWLVTADEIEDPQNLEMHLDLNGERMQTGNTETMIFSVAQIIAHLSTLFTLYPGDVISTGTPPGVGMGRKPPLYLKPGDVMTLEIEHLGTQSQLVVQG
jgi:ureidoglycolate lyase